MTLWTIAQFYFDLSSTVCAVCQALLDFVTCLFFNFSSASSSPLSTLFNVFIPLFTKINHLTHTAALRGAKLRPPTVSIVSRVNTAHCEKCKGNVLLFEHFINHHLWTRGCLVVEKIGDVVSLQYSAETVQISQSNTHSETVPKHLHDQIFCEAAAWFKNEFPKIEIQKLNGDHAKLHSNRTSTAPTPKLLHVFRSKQWCSAMTRSLACRFSSIPFKCHSPRVIAATACHQSIY